MSIGLYQWMKSIKCVGGHLSDLDEHLAFDTISWLASYER